MKKKQGCLVGSAGYRVSTNRGRRKTGENNNLSCVVHALCGNPTTDTYNQTRRKPSGSNGVGVCKTCGKPMGSTEANGFSVGKSGGRLIGSTEVSNQGR